MYYQLSGALKRRLILELKESFSRHPVYEKIIPFIENKYSFSERPQFGIVVKGASGNKVALSADNFMGTVVSYCALAYYQKVSDPIEWVREDTGAISANNGVFPTLPGTYYLEILKAPTNVSEAGQFVIDPLLTQTQEPVRYFMSGIEHEGQLEHIPTKGTMRMYINLHYLLKETIDYTIDYTNGAVHFLRPIPSGVTVYASYRYAVPSIGPFDFHWNQADAKTIPGVIMAFGKRAVVGDKVAIVVTGDRTDTADAYGGKFEFTFELDVISRDPIQMEEIADLIIMYLWAYKRSALAAEGIELIDISSGGEAEEMIDETGEEFTYTASISIGLRADWEVHAPLPFTISNVTASNTLTTSRLVLATVPQFVGRNADFERIT